MWMVGLDLGLTQDYTAISVLETSREPKAVQRKRWTGTSYILEEAYRNAYRVHHVERCELRTSYPDIVERAKRICTSKDFPERPTLIVDATGVGRPVVQMLQQAELAPVAVVIGTGTVETQDKEDGSWHVGKRLLVTSMAVLYHDDRIHMHAHLPFAKELREELAAFKVKISAKGHDSYEAWRERDHDDLVLSLALPAWYGERRLPLGWKRVRVPIGSKEAETLLLETRERRFLEAIERTDEGD